MARPGGFWVVRVKRLSLKKRYVVCVAVLTLFAALFHCIGQDYEPVVLLTGFEPFAGMQFNASEEGVRLFCESGDFGGRASIFWKVLPVVYDEAARQLREAVEELKPDVVIAFGISGERCYRIERIARNLDSCGGPDNRGEVRLSCRIIEDGPGSYEAPYPHAALARKLQEKGFPWRFSDSAGGFLCNHLFYHLCHLTASGHSGVYSCIFIHVPPLRETEDLGDLVEAIGCAVEAALGSES